MRRFLIAISLVGALLVLTVPAALAASAHFKKGGEPVCTISGGTTSKSTTCTATLSGLGGGNLDINTTVKGFAVYQCQNGGGNLSPGQNRVLEGPSTVPTFIDSAAIKNGNLTFHTNANTLSADATVSGSAAGCPNANWTGVNPVLTLTGITLDIFQPVDTRIFHCTASNSGGLSSPVTLTCVSP